MPSGRSLYVPVPLKLTIGQPWTSCAPLRRLREWSWSQDLVSDQRSHRRLDPDQANQRLVDNAWSAQLAMRR